MMDNNIIRRYKLDNERKNAVNKIRGRKERTGWLEEILIIHGGRYR